MADDAEGRYTAAPVACHACKTRDAANDAFDGPRHGLYWETTRKGR